mmetsp:Transcript_5899/g.13143  ORF Transcript_5899/g.13143 Transcript_5899/m.13143 type:complete len:91 (+) Transcript_5899:914-1186(+)
MSSLEIAETPLREEPSLALGSTGNEPPDAIEHAELFRDMLDKCFPPGLAGQTWVGYAWRVPVGVGGSFRSASVRALPGLRTAVDSKTTAC